MFQHRASTAAALATLVVVLAAGCGSDNADPAPTNAIESSADSPDPTPTAAALPPGTPTCDSVWQEDGTLPRPYDGCSDAAGEFVASDPLPCSSGQRIIRYDDHFYAVPGGTIHAADASLDKDSEYRAAALRCRA